MITYMESALKILDKLELKTVFSHDDYMDFIKAKTIIDFVIRETKQETLDKHTTPKYRWRTRGDGKVRSRHAKFNGEIFSWDTLPPGGYHPGEDWGCRCIAEPYTPESEKLREQVSQIVINSATDSSYEWVRNDFIFHYFFGEGERMRLFQIGLLQKTIDHARKIIFPKVEAQIIEKARRNGAGTFPWGFNRSYNFKPVTYVFGDSTVSGKAGEGVTVIEQGEYLIITADIDYNYYDIFTDALDIGDVSDWIDGFLVNKLPKELIARLAINILPFGVSLPLTQTPAKKPEIGQYDLPLSKPYKITGSWKTRIEAIVKK